MSAYSSPLHDLLKNTWQRCISLREWICRPIFVKLRSLCIHGHYNKKIGKLISHFRKYYSSMDIIEIDSSDSEDKFEDSGSLNGNIWPDDVEEQDVISIFNHKPYYASKIGTTSTSEHAQRRLLPPSFQNNTRKPVVNHSLTTSGGPITASRHKEYIRLEDDAEIINVNGKHRILPLSVTNGNSGAKFSTASRHMDDVQAHSMQRFPAISNNAQSRAPIDTKNSGVLHTRHTAHGTSGTGSLQNFPTLSFSNGYSTNFSTLASNETRGKSHFHAETSYTNGANSFDSPLLTSGKFEPMPKSSADSRDNTHIYGNVCTQRVLPSSLMPGKSYSQPVSGNEVQKHFGPGDDRRHEHDERAIYQEALQNLGQPKLEEDLPEGLLSVKLLKHQKIALAWMVQKEKSVHCAGGILADDQGLGKTISMIALIQKEMPQQFKFTFDDSNTVKPEALNLDDDDDMVSELDNIKLLIEDNDSKCEPATSKSNNARPAAGTLVVSPASVLQQWARELDEKVSENAKLKVLVYHGGSRTKSPSELAKYDVVITTYAIVTNEVPKQSVADDEEGEQKKHDKYGLTAEFSSSKKRKQTDNGRKKAKRKGKGLKDSLMDIDSGPLARVRWFRVILDEAQTIKNHRTQVARACCGLRAKRRWCLSGTPIQNTIDDLYSYFRFLKYEPYAIYNSFCTSIKHPISRNASQGYKKLQAILRAVLLRRTKATTIDGEPILKLPPKIICLEKVDFSEEERDFYMKLESESRQQFKAYAAAGTVKQNYANILLMLLRLRQACDHPQLVSRTNSDNNVKDSLETAKQLPREMLINLLNLLEGSLAICGVCSDPPEDAVVTMCGHVFCYQCVSERLTSDENSCPTPGCGNTLGTDLVFSRSTLRSVSDDFYGETSTNPAFDEESLITNNAYISSKIMATLNILKSISGIDSEAFSQDENCSLIRTSDLVSGGSKPNIPAKAIVFSQWTSMLDLLELSLNKSLIQYRRLDGTMTLIARDRAVKDFNTDPEVFVMLMSLKAGSLGLNMVAACHVILLDLWWNPTTEDQAVDRAHRIGQTRPVTVSRLTIKDTVEDRILALQEEKRNMVSSAFGEQSGGHTSRLTVEDLRYLFRVDDDD